MRCLLALALFAAACCAAPAPPAIRQAPSTDPSRLPSCADSVPVCSEVVLLKNGLASSVTRLIFFNFTNDDGEAPPPTEFSYETVEGKNVITDVNKFALSVVEPVEGSAVYTAEVLFSGFTGYAQVVFRITGPDGVLRERTHGFEVVGIVLFEEQGDRPHIVTGQNPPETVVQALDGGAFGTTVNVSIFAGNDLRQPVPTNNIRFVVQPEFADILPYNSEKCPIASNRVGNGCAMAFSEDFTTFSIEIPPDKSLDSPVKVEFEWLGMTDFLSSLNDENGVASVDQQQQNDIITSIMIRQNSTRSTGAATLHGWKIVVIAITAVLLLLAAIVLVCCFLCGKKRPPKKPEPDVIGFKDKFREIGFGQRLSTLRRNGGDDYDDDDQCYVEEPPTPDDAEILMLENDSRARQQQSATGHIEGLVPMDRPNDDKSVERLVLARGVVRGVDLEASTEGASAFGGHSGENEITSYERGMTSVPREQLRQSVSKSRRSREVSSRASRRTDGRGSRDGGGDEGQGGVESGGGGYMPDSRERVRSLERDRARIREVSKEIERERSARERPDGRLRPRGSVEEEELAENDQMIEDRTNEASRDRTGVGAAINRIRQLDLLNGPASMGLVGRNGEAIEECLGKEGSSGKIAAVAEVGML